MEITAPDRGLSLRNDGAPAAPGQTGARTVSGRPRRLPILAFVLVTFWASLGAWAATAPRIEIDQDTLDLGEIVRGDDIDMRFEIRNAGDRPLIISDAAPSCRCTVASYDKEVAARQIGYVNATLETEHLWGDVTRVIDLTTNDPEHRYVRLTLIAKVVGSVDFLPQSHVQISNRLPEYETARLLLRKTDYEEGELRVENVFSTVPWLVASAKRLNETVPAADGLPTGRPGDWLLEVRLVGQAPNGRSQPEIRFTTGLSLEPEFMLPVKVDFRPPLELSTHQVVFQGEQAARGETVTVSIRDGLDPQTLRVVTRPEGLTAVLQRDGARRYRVLIRWTGDTAGQGDVEFTVGGESLLLPVVRAAH